VKTARYLFTFAFFADNINNVFAPIKQLAQWQINKKCYRRERFPRKAENLFCKPTERGF